MKNINKKLKVCLISSTGGHLAQLKQLLPIMSEYEYFLVTEKNKTISSSENYKTYFLMQQERKNVLFLFVFITNIILSLYFLMKERPQVIISTGAGAVLPLCFFGKLLGKKIIFIESFAKITSPTITGRLIYKFADKFYVQWKDMLRYYPNAEYRGRIY